MVGEEVSFDDQTLLAPEEVDLPAAESDVDLGGRDVVAAVEVEERDLEVAARAIALDSVEVQAFVLRLPNRAADEVRWNPAVEVVDGPLDGGDGDAVAVGG